MAMRDEISTWDGETRLLMLGLGLVGVTAVLLPLGAWTYSLVTGVAVESYNPINLVRDLVTGALPHAVAWTGLAWAALILLVVALVAWRRTGKSLRGDTAATPVGVTHDFQVLTRAFTTKKAHKLGVIFGAEGLPVGETIKGAIRLFSDVESVCIMLSGPRTGKTTCWVIPRIFAAVGAVLATSNKRDIVDATRERREATGEKVWVFDPQGLADEPQTWFWNPLTYVTDAVSAAALIDVFIDATRDPQASTNAYFDSAARDLCAALVLAAASAHMPLLTVHRWLNAPTDQEPVRLLRAAGHELVAQSLMGTINLVPETRSGVYGSAAQIMSFLLNEKAMKWATPSPELVEFSPAEFVQSRQTLYCLSQEGRGSASPIVTALTVAVTEAALEYAKNQKGGRLAQPMLICLDEAANVCRWRELPDLYSHFGSRGILVDTILQSWSQGVAAWGEAGMKKLWSASNVKVYGGGVAERDFLSQLSDLIGVYWEDSVNVSSSASGQSVSRSRASQQKPIATVADLANLPRSRAWVFASGATATLARLIPFWEYPAR